MAYRNHNNQNIHDRVITESQRFINTVDYDMYTNPGSFKNAGIGNMYPDIILTTKNSKTIKFVIEVETSESITLSEAQNQWKKYATGINASFYLLVPINSRQKASQLCKQVGISVRFATFQTDVYGNIVNINWE